METQSFINGEIIDFIGLKCRARHGWTEAYCDCGGWVRITPKYMGDRTVIRQIPHNNPCQTYKDFLTAYSASIPLTEFSDIMDIKSLLLSSAMLLCTIYTT